MSEKCRGCGSEYGHSDDCLVVKLADVEADLEFARRGNADLVEQLGQLRMQIEKPICICEVLDGRPHSAHAGNPMGHRCDCPAYGENAETAQKATIDMLDNKIELLKEDIECVHTWLDDQKVPRANDVGVFSIVGRVQRLLMMGSRCTSCGGVIAPPDMCDECVEAELTPDLCEHPPRCQACGTVCVAIDTDTEDTDTEDSNG